MYKTAFCLAISDILEVNDQTLYTPIVVPNVVLLQQYKIDVAELEDKYTREGPYPLSFLIFQLQKV